MKPGLTLGFTGTSEGMTAEQLREVRRLIENATTLHFGDCVGADAEAFAIASESLVRTVAHPPTDPKKRAFCEADELLTPYPYLIRNDHIAAFGVDGLVAAPPDFHEVVRGRGAGTWSTVRRARKRMRKIWIVWPDGRITEEP